jgi:TetR/AcrR family transcriptional regulator
MRGARDAIVKAAIGLFARKGYAGASTREICAAAGITKPVLYYHFRSKEHLYQELMIDCFSEQQKTLLRSSKVRGGLRSRLVRILYDDFRHVRQDPIGVEMVLRMIFAPAEQRPYFNYIAEMAKKRALITRVFQEGIKDGEAEGDPQRLATALMGISTIAILENLFTGRRMLTRRSAEKYVDILLHGCSEAG